MNSSLLGKIAIYNEIKSMICKGFIIIIIFSLLMFAMQTYCFIKYMKLKEQHDIKQTPKIIKKCIKRPILRKNNNICVNCKNDVNSKKNKNIENFKNAKYRPLMHHCDNMRITPPYI